MAFNYKGNSDFSSQASRPAQRPTPKPEIDQGPDAGPSTWREQEWLEQLAAPRSQFKQTAENVRNPRNWQDEPVGQSFNRAQEAYKRAKFRDALENVMWPQHRLQKEGQLPVQEPGTEEAKYENAYIEMLNEDSNFVNPQDGIDPLTGDVWAIQNPGQYQIPLIRQAIQNALMPGSQRPYQGHTQLSKAYLAEDQEGGPTNVFWPPMREIDQRAGLRFERDRAPYLAANSADIDLRNEYIKANRMMRDAFGPGRSWPAGQFDNDETPF